MNWDQIPARWKQLKGRVRQRWGKLTYSALTTIAGKRERIDGKREQLAGELQAKYVHDKALSDKELDNFTKSLEPKDTARRLGDNDSLLRPVSRALLAIRQLRPTFLRRRT